MKPLVYSQRSLKDIEGILEFISRDKPEASLRFVENILQQCDLLSSAPTLGEKRYELLPDLRIFCFRNYGIYYRELPNQVRIERVLHGALNVSTLDFLD